MPLNDEAITRSAAEAGCICSLSIRAWRRPPQSVFLPFHPTTDRAAPVPRLSRRLRSRWRSLPASSATACGAERGAPRRSDAPTQPQASNSDFAAIHPVIQLVPTPPNTVEFQKQP
ncbi:MAG: hypothetical protein ACLTMP_10910 [Eggerthella lenta]